MSQQPSYDTTSAGTPITLPPVTKAEFNAVLAGLRALQHMIDRHCLPPPITGILRDSPCSLNTDQIDHLCHKLNCA